MAKENLFRDDLEIKSVTRIFMAETNWSFGRRPVKISLAAVTLGLEPENLRIGRPGMARSVIIDDRDEMIHDAAARAARVRIRRRS